MTDNKTEIEIKLNHVWTGDRLDLTEDSLRPKVKVSNPDGSQTLLSSVEDIVKHFLGKHEDKFLIHILRQIYSTNVDKPELSMTHLLGQPEQLVAKENRNA